MFQHASDRVYVAVGVLRLASDKVYVAVGCLWLGGDRVYVAVGCLRLASDRVLRLLGWRPGGGSIVASGFLRLAYSGVSLAVVCWWLSAGGIAVSRLYL